MLRWLSVLGAGLASKQVDNLTLEALNPYLLNPVTKEGIHLPTLSPV